MLDMHNTYLKIKRTPTLDGLFPSEFYLIPKALLDDNNLSWEAIGVAAYLFNTPPDEHINLAHLYKFDMFSQPYTTLPDFLVELVDGGYLEVTYD